MNSNSAPEPDASVWEEELRRVVKEVATMDDGEKAVMVDSLKQAVEAIKNGFFEVALTANADRLAKQALTRAAALARATPSK